MVIMTRWKLVLLLSVATLLLAFVSIIMAVRPSSEMLRVAKGMGLQRPRIAFDSQHVTLFLEANSDANKTFALLDHERQIIVMSSDNSEDSRGEDSAHGELEVAVGAEFSLACKLNGGATGMVQEYAITLRDTIFVDLNADGTFDMKMTISPNPRVELWYQGNWESAELDAGGHGHHKRRLLTGQLLWFSQEIGAWRPHDSSEQ